jgi:hypothetical protein
MAVATLFKLCSLRKKPADIGKHGSWGSSYQPKSAAG